jgi:hypothetical protein
LYIHYSCIQIWCIWPIKLVWPRHFSFNCLCQARNVFVLGVSICIFLRFLNCSDSVGFFVCHFIHMYLERCRLAQWHSNSSHFNLWNAILCIYIEIENYEWRPWFQFIYLVAMRRCQYIETWYKHPLAMKIGDLI